MELIEYDKTTIHKTHSSASVKEILSSQLVANTIQESGLSNYVNRDTILEKLEVQLTAIELTLGKDFTRQRILDLGCGSMDSFDTNLLGRAKFAPWLARVLHKLGVQIIGIDMGDLSKEQFSGIKLNLLEPNSLTAALGLQRFDLVHSASLYTSPMLQLLTSGDP